jgi:hypothetical protein
MERTSKRGRGVKEYSTHEIVEALEGKRDLLRWWEAQPIDVRERQMEYMAELGHSIRKLQKYLEHRRDFI